jgi:hypothetical protein
MSTQQSVKSVTSSMVTAVQRFSLCEAIPCFKAPKWTPPAFACGGYHLYEQHGRCLSPLLVISINTCLSSCTVCLQDAGAIPALTPLLLLSNQATTASAISTLAVLCNTPRAVAEFQRCDGLHHLTSLMSPAAKDHLSRRSQHQARKLLRRAGGAGAAAGAGLIHEGL